MLGIRYIKVPPTTYIVQYRHGQVVREGAGHWFFYFAPFAELVAVPLTSTDVPFVFNEVTSDFQDVTIQGQLTYRITDPKQISTLLDFSIDSRGRPRSDDPDKLRERLVQAAQILARTFTQQRTLRDVLRNADLLLKTILDGLKGAPVITTLGVEILDLAILSIKATPEMTKALQAEAREQLLREADEAVYARRNTAVELERLIRENELKTEIAVEQKRRQVREAQMEAEIAVEQQRTALVERRVANQREETAAQADALRAIIEPLKQVDWRTLIAASHGGGDPRSLIAMAFRDLADNAERIGTLSITPDLLSQLLRGPEKDS